MKKEIPVPVMISVIVAVVLVVGLIGWKMVSPSNGPERLAGSDLARVQRAKEAKDSR